MKIEYCKGCPYLTIKKKINTRARYVDCHHPNLEKTTGIYRIQYCPKKWDIKNDKL